jgi:hypothetical protein
MIQIFLSKTDKSNTIVVMDKQKYIEEVNRQLNDERYYKKNTKATTLFNKLKLEE